MNNIYDADMSQYPIYHADRDNAEFQIMDAQTTEEVLELFGISLQDVKNSYQEVIDELLEQVRESITQCNELKKMLLQVNKVKDSFKRDSIILSRFIDQKDEIFDKYIDYLKELKKNPSFNEYYDEIENRLYEFGEDDETLEWLDEHLEMAGDME